MKRTILYAAAALLLGGCFKSVGYDTDAVSYTHLTLPTIA